MNVLTKKQQQVYDYLVERTREDGYPPSIRELCQGLSIKSTSTVHGHLSKLEEKGFIRRDPLKNRAIMMLREELSPPAIDFVALPVVGRVSAGQPILAVENIEDYFPIPSSQLGSGEHFLLRIQGDSMQNAGILDSDYVLVQRSETARNGEYVVALLEDSATVKTFYQERDTIRLQPENPSYEPIYSPDIQIVGKVKGVFRFL